MSKELQICRICFSVNVQMFTLKNTKMENLYNLLTQTSVDIEDEKPATVCFLCYARLRQCDRLQQQAIYSNKLLEQLLKGGFMQATANAILNNQYTSQDLQTSPIYHLVLEPETYKDVFLDLNVEAVSPISVKEEKEAIYEGHYVTENLCKKEQEKEVKNDPQLLCSIQIQQKDLTSNNIKKAKEIHMKSERSLEKKKFQDSIYNYVDAEVDLKSNRKLKEMKTNIDPNKRKLHKPIHNKDTQSDININSVTSVINKITDKFQCNECGEQFSTKDILIDHILNCMKTTETSVSNSQLTKANVIKPLLSEMYSCDICSFKSNRKCFMETHLKRHNVTKVFTCNICEYRCTYENKLKEHVGIHTGEKPFSCNICEYRCVQKANLKTHMIKHTGEKPFFCNICEYRFALKVNLKHHLRTHTGEKPFFCSICQRKFSLNSHLKKHLITHTDEKPFFCSICQRKFALNAHLKQHIRRHTGEKPFSCNMCEFRSASESSLSRHQKNHTGEKPYFCNICQYRSAQAVNLKEHLRTHTGEKPLFCNMCEFKCASKSSLSRHKKNHTAEKPYFCNICQYRCAHSGHLKLHMRTHTGEKPFSCNICEFKSATKSSLNKHKKNHTVEKSFSCTVCEYRCSCEVDLKGHLRTHN